MVETLAAFLVAFLLFTITYERGLRNGYNLAKDKPTEQIQNPVNVIAALKRHKEEEKLTNEIDEVMQYTAEKALQAVKR